MEVKKEVMRFAQDNTYSFVPFNSHFNSHFNSSFNSIFILPYFFTFSHKMKKITFIVVVAFLLGTTAACHHDAAESHGHHHEAEAHDHHDHDHDHDHEHHHDHDHEHHHHGDNVIQFSNAQGLKVGLALEKIQYSSFGQVIRTTAQVLGTQGDEREATASAQGVVLFVNPDLVEGAAVKAGQKLFEIQSDGMADNNMSVRLQEATATYTAAKAAYERKKALVEEHIVTQAEVEQAEATYRAAKATYDNLCTHFSHNGTVVRAPISGYVKSINVRNGGFVETGRSVVTVAQNRDMMLRAEVSPRYYDNLKHITGVTIRVPDADTVYTLDDLHGSLVSYGKSTETGHPLLPVTFRVRNSGSLISGTFVNLYIKTASDKQVLTVANDGIVEEMGSFFVFVKVCQEEYEKRPVTLGATDGRRTEVVTGLNEGEWVVSHGAAMVKLAQGAAALDPHAGHVH